MSYNILRLIIMPYTYCIMFLVIFLKLDCKPSKILALWTEMLVSIFLLIIASLVFIACKFVILYIFKLIENSRCTFVTFISLCFAQNSLKYKLIVLSVFMPEMVIWLISIRQVEFWMYSFFFYFYRTGFDLVIVSAIKTMRPFWRVSLIFVRVLGAF